MEVTTPRQGASFGRKLKVAASAKDDKKVKSVSLYVDGKLVDRDTSAPYRDTVNARRLSYGTHTVTAKAYDSAGQIDADSAAQRTGRLEHRCELVCIEHQALGARQELLAVLGQTQSAGRAQEQPRAELRLQLLNADRGARLGQPELLARAREAAELRHAHEDAHAVDVHGLDCFVFRNSMSRRRGFRPHEAGLRV